MSIATEHPNATALRTLVQRWNAGDVEAVRDFFAEDCIVHMGGNSVLAGIYNGRDQIFTLMQRAAEASGGSLRFSQPDDVLADDVNGVVMVNVTGDHNGRTLDVPLAIGFGLQGTRCTKLWFLPSDREQYDTFFGA